MLAGTVDACKRLLMEQQRQVVLNGDLLHNFHGQLVLVGADVRVGEDGRNFMLRGSHFIVLRLGIDAQFPELQIQVRHKRLDPRLNGSEVVVVHLLAFRRLGAEEGAAGHNEVFPLVVEVPVNEEVLLFTADAGAYMLGAGRVAEQLNNPHGLFVQLLVGAEQGGLLVEDLAAIGDKDGRNAKGIVFNKGIGRRVPGGVAAGLKRGTDAAGGEGRGVRFRADEFLSGKLHENFTVTNRGNEAVVLLRGNAGHGLEPMRKVRGTVVNGPGFHGGSHLLCNVERQGTVFADAGFQFLVSLLRKALMHDVIIEHQTAENFGQILNFHNYFLLNAGPSKKGTVPLWYSAPAVYAKNYNYI